MITSIRSIENASDFQFKSIQQQQQYRFVVDDYQSNSYFDYQNQNQYRQLFDQRFNFSIQFDERVYMIENDEEYLSKNNQAVKNQNEHEF